MAAISTALAVASVGAGVAKTVSANKAAKAQVSAADRAADLQLQGQREAIAAQKAAEDRVYAETAYSRGLGENALTDFYNLSKQGFNPTGFQQSDGYQFQLGEGNKALDNMASARGITRSGAALKDGARFATGLADQDYSDWWNRENSAYTTQLNSLMNVATIGSGAQGQAINATQSTANNVGNALMTGNNAIANSYMAAGDARASGYTNTGNALSGMFGDGAGMLGMYQGGYFDNQKSLSGLFS